MVTLRPVDAVEIVCDKCGEPMPNPEWPDGVLFVRREDVGPWLGEDGWREEDGKHYCCGRNGCWPPSMMDEEEGEP